MLKLSHQFLNIKGHLMDLTVPKVMGILNVTPDSFYSGSRKICEKEVRERVLEMIREGVDIIDVGGCSTRPGFTPPSEKEEMERVELGCRIVREIAPEIPLSVDTFRTKIAENCIEEWNVDIINDISGGIEESIWDIIAWKNISYVLTHNSNYTSNIEKDYINDTPAAIICHLSKKLNLLHRKGIKDIIIDPGFGFKRNIDENFRIFGALHEFKKIGTPILVGISRKSMIYKFLNISSEEALTGTIALEALALQKGANILRVHDVKETVQIVKLFSKIKETEKETHD